jgi:hypothetical protein
LEGREEEWSGVGSGRGLGALFIAGDNSDGYGGGELVQCNGEV